MTDKETLISIITAASKSMSGAQSTKEWADDAIWFDIAPFASKGIKPASKFIDEAFDSLEACNIEIIHTDIHVNGDMGFVCSIQKLCTVNKDGTDNQPILVRQTDCFERQNNCWKIVHEHSSIADGDWDGKIVTD